MCESRFAGKRALIEKRGRAPAKPACLKVTAFVEKKQALVEVQKPGPHKIFLRGKHGPGFGKKLQSVDGFSLLTECYGLVRKCLGGFIAHPQLFKTKETLVRHLARFFAQIQLEINLRK